MRTCFCWISAFFLMVTGCTDQKAVLEQEAERMYVNGRDLEENVQTMTQAIKGYIEIAKKYPETSIAAKAKQRADQLSQVQSMFERYESVKGETDSLTAFYEEIVEVLPDYFAIVKRLGTVYYNITNFSTRAFVTRERAGVSIGGSEHVLNTWEQQDKLWSGYTFRPLPEDRDWQDRICKQAVDVARMFESIREYEKALKIVSRGLEYASRDAAKSHANVFASFYTYRAGRDVDAIALAKDALTYKFLPQEDQARAYHTIGLSHHSIHQDSGELVDLDAAIKALNEAVNIDAEMKDARELLKVLRIKREQLQAS